MSDAFDRWLEVSDVQLPVDAIGRRIALDGLRRAFKAGWEAAKDEGDVWHWPGPATAP